MRGVPHRFLAGYLAHVRWERIYLLRNSIVHMLAGQGRSRDAFSEEQPSRLVDAWVGLLTAPVTNLNEPPPG